MSAKCQVDLCWSAFEKDQPSVSGLNSFNSPLPSFLESSPNTCLLCLVQGLPVGSAVRNMLAVQEPPEMCVQSLSWEDPLEEGMATHSNILAWRIPRTEEPGGLQSIGLQRGRRSWSDWACTHAFVLITSIKILLSIKLNSDTTHCFPALCCHSLLSVW